jgi:hypothetical protein
LSTFILPEIKDAVNQVCRDRMMLQRSVVEHALAKYTGLKIGRRRTRR